MWLISLNNFSVFSLNESQLLYTYTTIAQVVAGMFGLTFTAYAFFEPKILDIANKKDEDFKENNPLFEADNTYYEAAQYLIKNAYYIIVIIALLCFFIMTLSIFDLISIHKQTNYQAWCFSLDEVIFLFVMEIVTIIYFGINTFNPQKYDKTVSKLQKRAEHHFNKVKESKTRIDISEFLSIYNKLENLVISFAKELINLNNKQYKGFAPLIIQSLKVLINFKIITDIQYNDINQIRMYRNGLVHGSNFNVSMQVYDRMKQIFDDLQNKYSCYIENNRDLSLYRDKIVS